ncbi:MAG: hypothetical protein Q6353_009460, partial [Candidatus Sigynarchaeum springense]
TCPTRKIVMGGPWATIEHRVIVAKGTADIVVRCEGEHGEHVHRARANTGNRKIKGASNDRR